MPLTVITLKKSTPSLRGDLTKWMQEISTGVYIGNFNTRIREKLWERVKETVGEGEATLSYAYRNEIGYQFETWNTQRENIDYEGIPLVLLPTKESETNKDRKTGFSDASKFRQAKKYAGTKPSKKFSTRPYIVLDIETDGLDEKNNIIIEVGAVKLDGENLSEFNCLIQYEKQLPETIVQLTGITDDLLRSKGIPLVDALEALLEFIGDDILVGYGVDFDICFINRALEQENYPKLKNKHYDLMRYVKREKMFLKDYKLQTALQGYGILEKVPHRALQDAHLIALLSTKVNQFQSLLKQK